MIMPDWLTHAFSSDAEIALDDAAVRLVAALALGCCVALIHRWTRGAGTDRRFVATLVLLTVLLAVTTIVIGNNVARAFSIVGALSIVRFRTVVEDTRDTAFVICAVAMGLAVGAGYMTVPILALVVVAVAAKSFGSTPRGCDGAPVVAFRLVVRVTPEFAQLDALQCEITSASRSRELLGIESSRGGTASKRTYQVGLAGEENAGALIQRLGAIDGVLSVEVIRDGR
ncbi:MAG: DUF4956 domain-containing protein [Phycisphaerae bacterium]|nr:DUF4956 domain-containing protein [Phycisphaerae bacterium]